MTAQLTAALSDRYRIEREIGRGGMATVYLARDLKHDRNVALKVLDPELGAVLGVDRFLSEIRVTANLQHPNLLPLFDSGSADGLLFYVMPFVEGESLRARLQREKQLPVDEAIRIAAAVASAVDYAHRQAVIHRDLKPENILLHDGQPVVADFGIALAVSKAGGARVTQTGLSLGTPQYMSPEQATGDRAIDQRTDIYSLGAVTYEMLCGDPPHTGSTAQAIIAKVITDKPRGVRLTRDTVPAHVEFAIDKALAKLPADRFATARDFADALLGKAAIGPTTRAATSESSRHRITAIAAAAAIAAVVALVGVIALLLRPTAVPKVVRLRLVMSDSAPIAPLQSGGVTMSLSRDGRRLAYVGGSRDGQIFVRDLSALDSRVLPRTDGGRNPVFSPDGKNVLFTADGRLKRVGVEGGAAITIADSVESRASWGDRDVVLYERQQSLYRVSASGGVPERVLLADSSHGIHGFRWPSLLPGSHTAVVSLVRGRRSGANALALAAVDLDKKTIVDLHITGTNASYVPTGHLVFGGADGIVYGVPFDAKRLRVTGRIVPLLQDVVIVRLGGGVEMTVADDGTLVYRSGTVANQLRLVDREGHDNTLVKQPRSYLDPRVSPDGSRIAVSLVETTSGITGDIWVFDLRSGALTRVTHESAAGRAEWSPDGKNVAYVHSDSGYYTAAGRTEVMSVPWDGSGAPKRLIAIPNAQSWEIAMPRVRRGYMAVRVGTPGTSDIWIAPVDSPAAIHPFVATPADEFMPSVSPDGQWLAYVSNESGRNEVYLRAMPGPGGRVQVSDDGGTEPAWSPTGQELFYRGNRKIVSALITRSADGARISRANLFDDVYPLASGLHTSYAVTPDGNHFVFAASAGLHSTEIITFNWFEELRERMATAGRK